MQLVPGLGPLNLPSLFAEAKRRIILHAAVYGPFAESTPHREGLTAALSKASFEKLDIIAITDKHVWTEPFMHALRLGASEETLDATLQSSQVFLKALKTDFPDKVHIYPQSTFPCLPIVIVDDRILFGQYAHSEAFAADGLWGVVETDVDRLFQWAQTTGLPSEASASETATYRLVSECHQAMTGAK